MKEFEIRSNQRNEFIDITDIVDKAVSDLNIKEGVCFIYTPHTTAALTINENADPSVTADINKFLNETIPEAKKYFRHLEGNSDAHIKSSLIGNSLFVLIQNGALKLGTWQGIYFCEFDGPRARKVWVSPVSPAMTGLIAM